MRQRHPLGLYLLFFTEMWERFGFYTMESVFVYYMKVSQYEFLRENSSRIYGWYLAGVYFSPFFGGLLAESWLGYFLSIMLGGASMAVGYFLLSLEPAICFAVGLLCVIIGNGLFKPNISSLVSKLYPSGDGRIDSAFTIFYVGINIGALFAPIIAGVTSILVAKHTNWEERHGYLLVFAFAGVGMLIGQAFFLITRRWIRVDPASSGVATAASASSSGALQRRRNIALVVFFVINIVFWMAFKQRANSMALWIKDRTILDSPDWLSATLQFLRLEDLMLKDGLIAPALYLTLNPLFVILLSPLMAWLWRGLGAIGLPVPTPAKLVIGFVLLTASYFLMWRVAEGVPEGTRASSLVIVQFYALLTASELCLSPMGLSLVSKLASPKTRAIWMGLFFVSISVGGFLAGEIYQQFKKLPFADFFKTVTWASVGALVLMLLAYPLIASALRTPTKDPEKSS